MTRAVSGSEAPIARFLREATEAGAVDFHLHSSFSDGAQTPEELVAEALINGLRAFSLTDHDSMAGIPAVREALSLIPRAGRPVFVAGVECSARYLDQEVHLLGYFDEDQPVDMMAYLDKLAADRDKRNRAMIERLRELGYGISYEDLFRHGHSRTMAGRAHMALWLVEEAGFASIEEAFQELLNEGRPAFVYRERRLVPEIVQVIRQSGGVVVLAHPQQYDWYRAGLETGEAAGLLAHFKYFRQAGVGGIECFHGQATPGEARYLREIARQLDMFCTAGSDSHGRADQHAPMYRDG